MLRVRKSRFKSVDIDNLFKLSLSQIPHMEKIVIMKVYTSYTYNIR